jgi:hypothetical protein
MMHMMVMVHVVMHHLFLGACRRRHCKRDSGQRGQRIRKFFHEIPLALLVHADAGTKKRITNAANAANTRIMNERSVTVHAYRIQPSLRLRNHAAHPSVAPMTSGALQRPSYPLLLEADVFAFRLEAI